jgi:hypothetical protein
VGGTVINDPKNRLSREEALRLWTKGSAWFSGEGDTKGELSIGQLADFAVLDNDYFTVDDDEIRGIESVLTVVDGEIVYATNEFAAHNPDLPPVSPDWSPVKQYGGYHNGHTSAEIRAAHEHGHQHLPGHSHWVMGADGRAWQTGCNCSV